MIQNANANKLADLQPNFIDERLPELLLHYKARNYPTSLSEEESIKWEEWRAAHINSQLPNFIKSMQILSSGNLPEDKSFMLEELKLWVESIIPENN